VYNNCQQMKCPHRAAMSQQTAISVGCSSHTGFSPFAFDYDALNHARLGRIDMTRLHTRCPRCGTETIPGYLRVPGDTVYIQSERSRRFSALQAVICPGCGHVELRATCPEDLSRHERPDEEPNDEYAEDDESP
jgi:ribosomal protein L32